jgi:hypothetical protein
VKSRTLSEPVSRRIADFDDWRGKTLERIRKLIHEADPDVTEDLKWAKAGSPGTPTWSDNGIICTGEAYKGLVKLTFAKGASLKDPKDLFNAGLDGNVRRAIDIREGDRIDAAAFKALVREAVAVNQSGKAKSTKTAKAKSAKKAKPSAASKPKLLAGGNPQIAKGDGDAPVQAYIAAMPGWKREVGRRLDALVSRTVPRVRKAVKWNSPFYGVEGQGWFLNFHCFTKYVKVAFFKGTSLRPVPPGKSAHKEVRYVDIYEDEPMDQAQMASWIKQAAAMPGWIP